MTTVAEAFVTLRPELKGFESAVKAGVGSAGSKAGGQFGSDFAKGVRNSEAFQLGGVFQTIGSRFSAAGRIATIGFTAPIVAGFALAAKASIDFESAFAGVRQKVSGTPAELQAIADGARAMSKELPFSAVEILNVAKTAGQLGVKTGDIQKFTRVVLEMAETTNLTAEQAATSMAKLANILDLGGDSFDRMGSTILALGNIGASTEADITEMALRIAGAGKVVGLSADQVLGFANALATVGLDAESGGTAISRAFVEIANAVAGLAPSEEQLLAVRDAQRSVRDSADSLVSAQRTVRNAAESVVDAYASQASAQRTIRNANESLSDAYRDLARAQRDQTQASFDARRETLSVAEAEQHLAELRSKNPALEQRDAQLQIAEAQRRLTEAIKQSGAGSLEAAQAQQSLNQARQRAIELSVSQRGRELELRSAELSVEEARSRVGQARVTQADRVAGAERALRNAVDARKDADAGAVQASRNVRNALEGVGDAQKGVVKANEGLGDSQKKLNDLTDATTGKLGLFAKVAGLSVDEFVSLFKRDAAGAMELFIEGLGKVQKEGGNTFGILDKLGLGEIRVRDALLRLSGADGLVATNLTASAKAWAENTELQRQAAIVNETNAAKLKILKNELTDVAITLGDALVPVFKDFLVSAAPLLDIIRAAAQGFADLPRPVQTVLIAVAALVAIVGPFLIGLGLMISGLGGLVTLAPFVAAAFGIILSPVGLFILAIGAAVLAGYLLYKNWDTIKAAAAPFADAVTGAFGSVLDFLKNNWREVATVLAGPFAPVVALATDAFGIRSALEDALGGLAERAGELASGVANTIADAFSGGAGAAGNFAGGLASTIADAFNAAANAARDGIESVLSTIASNFNAETAGQVFGFYAFLPLRIFREAFEAVLPVLQTFFTTTLPNFFTQVIPSFARFGFSMGSAVVGGIASGFSAAFNALQTFFTSTLPSFMLVLGKGMISALVSGITAAWDAGKAFLTSTLPNAITGAASVVIEAAKKLGGSIISGISSGISAAMNLITAAPGVIKDAFVAAFNGLANSFLNIGRQIVEGVWNGIKAAKDWFYNQIKDFFGGLVKAAKGAVGIHSPSTVFAEIGQNIVKGLAVGLEGANRLTVPMPGLASAGTDWYQPQNLNAAVARIRNPVAGTDQQTGAGVSGGTALAGVAGPGDVNVHIANAVFKRGANQSDVRTMGWGVVSDLRRRGVYA